MNARSILSAVIPAAFVLFIPLDDVLTPALFFAGLLIFVGVLIFDTVFPRAPERANKMASCFFVLALVSVLTSVLFEIPPRTPLPGEPEERISSASYRL